MMALSTSLTLIDKLRIRDNEGWERFVRLYTPLILNWARESGLQAADCESVVSDVFAAVLSKIRTFQPGTFRGWLKGVTKHKAVDCHRRNGRQPDNLSSKFEVGNAGNAEEFDSWGEESSNSQEEYWHETQRLYRRAVRMICESGENGRLQWNIIRKTLIEGQRVQDVAREFDYKLNSIYKLQARVLERVKRDFRQLIKPETAH